MPVRIHYLQHVCFEDLAGIRDWAVAEKISTTGTRLYAGEPLPDTKSFDWLIVLGGPMNVDEHEKFPWLAEEKRFIHEAIERKKIVLGICLGGQLIAEVLGARVIKNRFREIGWFPVKLTPKGRQCRLLKEIPSRFSAFHWHGDMFDIPPKAHRLALSEACPHQAFLYGDRVLGLQFHLEYAPESVRTMLHFCSDELTADPYVQTPEEMLGNSKRFLKSRQLLDVLLTNLNACRR